MAKKISETKVREIVRRQLQIKKLNKLHEKMTGKVDMDSQGDPSKDAISPDVLKFFDMLKSKSQLVLAASRLNTKQEKIDAIALFMMRVGVEDINMLQQALPKVKTKMKEMQASQDSGADE